MPLYGTYLRRVTAVKQKPAGGIPDEWAINFQSGEAWDGVLEMYYLAKEPGSPWGRAYEYSSDNETLRLTVPTRPEDVKLRLGGFECQPDGPATYAWSRSDRNYTLRLEAIEEPCAVRRSILEGDWHFFD